MRKLNPIQILDLQELARLQVTKLLDTMEKQKDWRAKEVALRAMKSYESSIVTLEEMFKTACREETEEAAKEAENV